MAPARARFTSSPGMGDRIHPKNCVRFNGEVGLPSVKLVVEVTGGKATDQYNGGRSSWSVYSEAEYERANTNRWQEFENRAPEFRR